MVVKKRLQLKEGLGYNIYKITMHLTFVVFSLSAILPMILAVVISFTDETAIIMNGYSFFPEKTSTLAYRMILEQNWVFRAYAVTIFVTVVGTILCVVLSAMCAYAISIPSVKYRNAIALYLFIPMVFNAGIVPWYLTVTKTLQLKNSLLALILPLLVQPFWIFLIRNYFKTIPSSLIEAAEIDGASKMHTFFRIVLPISKPILATVSLFSALMYWNDYVMALWLVDEQTKWPLQYMLFKIQSLIAFITKGGGASASASAVIPSESFVMAIFVVAMGPILLVYPFIQKYFVKGIVMGAVKG